MKPDTALLKTFGGSRVFHEKLPRSALHRIVLFEITGIDEARKIMQQR
jgi:hypothetical protein